MKNFRRAIAFAAVFAVSVCISACGNGNVSADQPSPTVTAGENNMSDRDGNKTELAFITFNNSVYEDTLNDSISKTVKAYADKNNVK